MPYGVVDVWEKCLIINHPQCSLMVFLPPYNNQFSNEQWINVEYLFIRNVWHESKTVFSPWYLGCANLLLEMMTIRGENVTLPNLLKSTHKSAIVFGR